VRRSLLWVMLLSPAALFGQEPERLSVTAVSAPDSLVGFHGRVQDAERTTLTIRELWPGATDTAQFDVVYLRLPARQPSRRSPIVFLMGGPGVPASVIGRIPPYWTLFDRLRDVADVILLDQRGVGLSRPLIDCPSVTPPAPDLLASLQSLDEGLRSAFAPCVSLWRSRGVRAEMISVSEIAADIEAIRRRLGVPRVSLLGFSYGTRLVLEYVKAFPDRVDRTVLQGTLGFENGVRLPATLDSLLDRVSATVVADSVGRALAPDLRAALAERFEALRRQPVNVTASREPGDSIRLTVGAQGLQAIVTGHLADPRLPALVATLGRGDLRLLAGMAGGIYRDLAQGGGSMFGRAVYCSAPGPEDRELLARAQARTSVLGELFDNVPTSPEFCRGIGIASGPRARAPSRPVDRPALMITGTLDDRTPPGNAESARRYFTTPTTVVVENGGHELLPSDTVQSLVVEFFRTGRVGVTRLTLPPPRFMSIEEALQPPRRR
jgi:pimeloyl-ACP methyl ester carboxylesterase